MAANNAMATTDYLVTQISSIIPGKVSAEQESTFKNLVDYAEPDVAIVKALNWTLEDAWAIPERLIGSIKEWADSHSRSAYRSAAERALIHAGMLVPA